MHQCKTYTSTILIVCACVAFAVAAVFAVFDDMVSGRAFAAGLVGLGVATAALAANTRQVAGGLAVAVERAPRDQYWRGYKDRGDDAGRPLDDLDES